MALKQLDDSQQDERYNPSGAARDLYKQENNRDAFDDIANNYDKTADGKQENDNIAKLKDGENAQTNIPGQESGWKTNVSSGNTKQRVSFRGRFNKKTGIIGGLIALVLGGGGIGMFLMSPSMMLIDLSERFTLKNDTASTAMERRMMKVFGTMTSDGELCSKGKNIKCRMGKISNSGLRKLNKKGITAIFDAGADGKGGTKYSNKRTGYPDKNPTHYEIDVDGQKRTVKAADLKNELLKQENRKIANKVFGRAGAFNMRVSAWTGKYANKFYDKFKIRLNGGLADGQNKKLSASERLKAAQEKLRNKIPAASEGYSNAKAKITEKVKQQTNKAKRGGTGYMIAVAGCISAKAPSFIAAGVAAVQLAQIMPYVSDLVLSPGSKAKASGVDVKNSITAEDMDTVGTLLTNKTKNADGKMTSALDSPYLLKALGTNTAKTAVSKKFTPGYSVMTSPAIKTGLEVEKDTKEACNAIMSPAAMWSAFAIDSAATVAASTTIIGGIIKVAASWAVSSIIAKVIEQVATKTAVNVIEAMAKNDDIPKAQGEELGDVLGISALSFFSAGGMNRHLPVLSEAQVTAYQSVKNENIAFMDELEKSDVNPLDITSRNTIPGSILANIRTAALQTGAYGTPLAVPAALASLPQLAFTQPAFAAETNDCNYAKDFGLDTGNPKTTPAINAAGLPCTGITPTQAGMSTEDAIQLLENEDWLDTSIDIDEGATIDELLEKGQGGKYGVIKKDTPLSEFVLSCSDASTGDYVFSSGGCVSLGEGSSGSVENRCSTDSEGKERCFNNIEDDEPSTQADMKVKNKKSLQAISVFLLDYQVMQAINGDDEATDDNSNAPDPTESTDGDSDAKADGLSKNWVSPVPKNVTSAGTSGYGEWRGQYRHEGEDFAYRNADILSICDGVVTRVDNKGDVRTPGNVSMSNHLTVDCGGGIYARYHHYYYRTVKAGIKVGAKVTAGQPLAEVGSQGNTQGATGIHLHMEIRTKDNVGFQYTKDPIKFLRSKGVSI